MGTGAVAYVCEEPPLATAEGVGYYQVLRVV